MKSITIKTEYIKLSQLLKLAGIVGQGSDAKLLILDLQVKVNDIIAIERGKKIYNDDVVLVKGNPAFVVKSEIQIK